MFAWYEEASGVERRTFWGCFGGWALDAMDVQLYSPLGQAIGLFAAMAYAALLLPETRGREVVAYV